MENILNHIIMVAFVFLLLILMILVKKAYEYFKSLLKQDEAAALDQFVEELVGAADQLFKQTDPDGSVRLEYVCNQLVAEGYELTNAIRAKIENYVLKLGHGDTV